MAPKEVSICFPGERSEIDPVADRMLTKYLPNIPGLDGTDDSLLAVLISHPHLDHFGLLGHILDKIPVNMGREARNILTKATLILRYFMPDKYSELFFNVELNADGEY